MDFYDSKIFIASDAIKYSSIILCFLVSILSTKNSLVDVDNGIDLHSHASENINSVNYRDIELLQWGMFITVIADLCLVIFDFYILGLMFFSLVQITYSVRYAPEKCKTTLINFFITFLCIGLLYLISSLFSKEFNFLIPISLFYSICLLTSVIKSIKSFKSKMYTSPYNYMIVFGMILFLLCDICVALSNITVALPQTAGFIIRFQLIVSFLIWVFYLPSQLLLALSGS
jgi:peptidoglycan biosynthesis protein MviN/MurJ (putative lipid II flippase)